jgi:hypothetical protein
MRIKFLLFSALILSVSFMTQSFISTHPFTGVTPEREAMINKYSEVPREEMEKDPALMNELKARYKKHIATMNQKVGSTGAKFVVMYMTPEVGNSMTNVQRMGRAFLKASCQEMGIDFIDVTKNLGDKDPSVITNHPVDGHFSKIGAKIIAEDLEKLLPKYAAQKSTAKYTNRPAVFGDQAPNQNQVMDLGKKLPFRLITNKQGLRQNHDVTFPKTKTRVLFMGDSGFFFPFMDNNDMAHELLKAKMPQFDFNNACNWGYAIDDYITLWDERAKFVEPDVVVMQTSGSDIIDMYFSNRNRFSRNPQAHQPSALEKAYYERTFKK